MNQRRIVQTLGVVIVSIVASMLILRFGWQSIFPTIYLAFATLILVFGRFRAFFIAIGILVLLGFFLPAIDPARPTIRRMKCSDNLRQIASAIRQYESTHGVLPPPYVLSDDGVPLFGWRVLLLPYIGEEVLFEKLDLTKPWNDPFNLTIGEDMPIIFRCPESRHQSKWRIVGTMTSYVAVVGPQTAWPPNKARKLGDFDADVRNILIVESVKHETHWLSPCDPTIGEYLSSGDFDKPHGGMVNFVDVDGNTLTLSDNVSSEQIQEFLAIQHEND